MQSLPKTGRRNVVEHSKREVELMAIVYNRSGAELIKLCSVGMEVCDSGFVLDLFLNAIILVWFHRLKKR